MYNQDKVIKVKRKSVIQYHVEKETKVKVDERETEENEK